MITEGPNASLEETFIGMPSGVALLGCNATISAAATSESVIAAVELVMMTFEWPT
ncbi:MAG: hypothetical protein ABIW33_05620 [Sphingomicrobium sp.]